MEDRGYCCQIERNMESLWLRLPRTDSSLISSLLECISTIPQIGTCIIYYGACLLSGLICRVTPTLHQGEAGLRTALLTLKIQHFAHSLLAEQPQRKRTAYTPGE